MKMRRFWLSLLALVWVGRGCPGLLHLHRGAFLGAEAREVRLLDRLAAARLLYDTTSLDLGKPLPRGTLESGWSWNESWPGGGDGNWAVEREAELRFPLLARVPRRLLLWMAAPPDRGTQTVEAWLNETRIGRLGVGTHLRQYELDAPAEAVQPGINRLRLRFGALAWEKDRARRLAAVLDTLLVQPSDAEGELRLRPEQPKAADWQVIRLDGVEGAPRALRQPGDSAAEFALLPVPGAELCFLRQAEAADASAVATAIVEVCAEGGACREASRVGVYRPEPSDWVEERVPLPELEAGPAIVRLRVESLPRSWGAGWPGSIWGEPRIVGSADLPARSAPKPGSRGESPWQEVQEGSALLPAGGPAGSSHRPSGDPHTEPGAPPQTPPGTAPLDPPFLGTAPREAFFGSGLRPVRRVLVYLVDTLREDAVIDPALDLPNVRRFLGESAWWPEAWASASWTRPAVGSLFTSLLPSAHGAQERTQGLLPGLRTLAGWLASRGVETGAIAGNGNIASDFGFARGFQSYRHLFAPAPEIHAAALDWLHAHPGRAFLYLHVTEPHDPYSPEPPWSALAEEPRFAGTLFGSTQTLNDLAHHRIEATPNDRDHLKALYRAETREWDASFGNFLAQLRQAGLMEDTAIVLLSDHGEEFEEHGGWLHGTTLEPEQTRMLLAIRSPGGPGAARSPGALQPGLASTLDVAPAVCALLGEAPAPEFTGQLPGARDELFQELLLDGVEREGRIGPDWDYSASEGVNHAPRLYAHAADPGHRHNLASSRPILGEALEQDLVLRRAAWRRGAGRVLREDEITPETLEHLRALGYLGN